MSGDVLADYRQHPLFGKDCHALQIFLYYDDAEVVNPLGSSATIHKLGKHIYIYTICTMYVYVCVSTCMCTLRVCMRSMFEQFTLLFYFYQDFSIIHLETWNLACAPLQMLAFMYVIFM